MWLSRSDQKRRHKFTTRKQDAAVFAGVACALFTCAWLALPSGEPHRYEPAAWSSSETWVAVPFAPREQHHYSYQYDSNGLDDMSTFTATAFGDLDGDGRYSVFGRAGCAIIGCGEITCTCGDSSFDYSRRMFHVDRLE